MATTREYVSLLVFSASILVACTEAGPDALDRADNASDTTSTTEPELITQEGVEPTADGASPEESHDAGLPPGDGKPVEDGGSTTPKPPTPSTAPLPVVTGPSLTFSASNDYSGLYSPYPIFSLRWSALAGTTCTASGAWTGAKLTAGTEKVTKPGVYRLTCANATGSTSKDLVVSCAIVGSGLNIGGNVCTVCPGTTASNGQHATCTLDAAKKSFLICSGVAGSMLCGAGPVPAKLGAPKCLYSYSAWTVCIEGKQTRSALTVSPAACEGAPVESRPCQGS